jgi:hypothetical protein
MAVDPCQPGAAVITDLFAKVQERTGLADDER